MDSTVQSRQGTITTTTTTTTAQGLQWRACIFKDLQRLRRLLRPLRLPRLLTLQRLQAENVETRRIRDRNGAGPLISMVLRELSPKLLHLQGAPAKFALVPVLDARPKLLHLQLGQAAFGGQVG